MLVALSAPAAVHDVAAATCTGGSLGLTSPSAVTFPSLTLNGLDATLTTQVSLTPSDMTGTNAGWNITGTSTTFDDGAGHTLPVTATSVTAGSATADAGTCTLPTNSIAYPATLPAGATAPAAAKLFDAATSTGTGTSTVQLTFSLAVPADAHAGTYSSTWTLSIVSGP
jgi:hypothetical protein